MKQNGQKFFLIGLIVWGTLLTITENLVNAAPTAVTGELVNNRSASIFSGTTSIPLPIGQQIFKLETGEAGIYEVTYADLLNAGMDVATANPHQFQMVHRGQAIATQFVGDSDSIFESGESLRFYGEAIDDLPRLERQYLTHNVYWLWANGSPLSITVVDNPTGYPIAGSWRSSVTLEEENHWFSTWTGAWEYFPNEPDAWFMERLIKGAESSVTGTYTITLPYPNPSGMDAEFTAELNSRTHPIVFGVPKQNSVAIYLNAPSIADASASWWSNRNLNITGTVPASRLNAGANQVDFVVIGETNSSAKSYIYPNRVTVEYDRLFVADGNELMFATEDGGGQEFVISNIDGNYAGSYLAWNLVNPKAPVSIPIAPPDIVTNTIRIGGIFAPNNQFIVTAAENMRSPIDITPYTPPNIMPASGADWVAISHQDFMTAAVELAAHRADPQFGGLQTHVVDVTDIINQYGYGLPLPEAIRAYLRQAIGWQTPARYVTLFGDATINPRQIECQLDCNANFNNHEPNFIPTDLQFVDRFQGLIPSDVALAFLAGDDFTPDIAIGRLAIGSLAEAEIQVDKIILYEQNLLTAPPWSNEALFIADNADPAGDFCLENETIMANLPEQLKTANHCLPANATESEVLALRTQITNTVNITGALILNYRGHGFIDKWATESIFAIDDVPLLTNASRPFVSISADCLDGYFAYPGLEAISETLLSAAGGGSAAHWSSSGLGILREHHEMHRAFYEGLFEKGHTAIGDAILYSQIQYAGLSASDPIFFHISELYAFTLQGDPAMQLMRPSISVTQSVETGAVAPGETAAVRIEIDNAGNYPAPMTLTQQMPASLTPLTVQGEIPFTSTINSGEAQIWLTNTVGLNQSLVFTISLHLTPTFPVSASLSVTATASAFGAESAPGDETAITPVELSDCSQPTSVQFSAGLSGANMALSWLQGYGWDSIQLYRGDSDPYYAPTANELLATLPATQTEFTDSSSPSFAIYLLQPTGCKHLTNAHSNRVGLFQFQIEN